MIKKKKKTVKCLITEQKKKQIVFRALKKFNRRLHILSTLKS